MLIPLGVVIEIWRLWLLLFSCFSRFSRVSSSSLVCSSKAASTGTVLENNCISEMFSLVCLSISS